MSTWQQMPYGSGAAPPPPGFFPQGGIPYPQGAPYPKTNGGYVPNGGYPSGDGPPPYTQQPLFGIPNIVQQNNSYNGNASDSFGFSDKTIRKNFISKVYSIVMVQLLVTFLFVLLAAFHEPTKLFTSTNPGLFIVAIIISFGTLIALACSEDLRRKSPSNFILLFVFTIAESYSVAVSVSHHFQDHVLLALGITTLVCFALTIFALQTKVDFTVMGGFLMVAAIVLLIVSIVAIFFPGKLMALIIASIGAIIFSLYLIYDTQLMMGGEHNYSISPEEYIFAALNIYIDVINIFMYILTFIGASSDN